MYSPYAIWYLLRFWDCVLPSSELILIVPSYDWFLVIGFWTNPTRGRPKKPPSEHVNSKIACWLPHRGRMCILFWVLLFPTKKNTISKVGPPGDVHVVKVEVSGENLGKNVKTLQLWTLWWLCYSPYSQSMEIWSRKGLRKSKKLMWETFPGISCVKLVRWMSRMISRRVKFMREEVTWVDRNSMIWVVKGRKQWVRRKLH